MKAMTLDSTLQASLDQADVIISNQMKSKWIMLRYQPATMEEPTIIAMHEGKLKSISLDLRKHYSNDDIPDVLLRTGEVGAPIPEDTYRDVARIFSTHFQKIESKSGIEAKPELLDDGITHRQQLWLLRSLMTLGSHKSFLTEHGFKDDKLAYFLGIGHLEEKDDLYTISTAKYILKEKLSLLENQPLPSLPQVLQSSLDKLQQVLQLSDIDIDIFTFAIMLHASRVMDDAMDLLNYMNGDQLIRALAGILNHPESTIRQALSNNSLLSRTGLIRVNRSGAQRMMSKLEILTASALDLMMDASFEPMDLLKTILKSSPNSDLSFDDDYQHFEAAKKIIYPYLKQASTQRIKGVNIFLYGAPGTGKTEFVKAIADKLSIPCYEVSSQDEDGDPVAGSKRLNAYASAQNILKDQPCIIMFDEVEEIFVNDIDKSVAQQRKAWFTLLLENNVVPTIWISNKSRGIDPAFIRRFDMAFEMPMPTKQKRIDMLTQSSAGKLSSEAIERFAKHQALAPAMIDQACKVIHNFASENTNLDEVFEEIVSNKLKLQRHEPIEQLGKTALPQHYNPDYMNTDIDMKQIALSLTNHESARICLYGPPGTGKTAYGHYLAQQLSKPIHLKKASDLISKYVGGTEENLAAAFKEAQEEKAILMIDEVDTFIFDRSTASRSWEVSAVNEMLTQMETYEGIFIASTNRMDGLDPAALRRFDIKVKVDYLNQQQRLAMFEDACVQLQLDSDTSLANAINALSNITPGDFALIIRQHRFKPVKNALALLSALEAESKLKSGHNSGRIGF